MTEVPGHRALLGLDEASRQYRRFAAGQEPKPPSRLAHAGPRSRLGRHARRRRDPRAPPARPHPHGTAMAGAIAAHGKLIGVAPRVRLLAIRAFGAGADRKARASAGTWARRRATMNAAPESPTRSMPSPRCSRNRRRNNWHSGTECTPRKRLNPKQREQIPSPRRPRVFPGSAIYRLVQVGNIRLGPAAGRVARCHPKSAAADFGNYSWPSRKHPTWPTPRRVGAEKNPTAKRPPPLTPPHRAGHPTTQVHRGDPASRGGRGTQPPSSWRH